MRSPTAFFVRTQSALVLLGMLIVPIEAQPQEHRTARAIVKCEIAGETVYTDLSCGEAGRIARELSPGYRAPEPSPGQSGEDAAPSALAEGPAYHAIALDLPNTPAYGRNPECPHLEQRIALVEAEGRLAVGSEAISSIEERLAVQRSWHRQLGC